MSKLKIITRHTYKPGTGRETSTKESLTSPGETRTIGDILKRYQQTGEIPQTHNAGFMDVEDIDNINHLFSPSNLDLTDIEALHNRIKEGEKAIEDAIKKQKKAEAEAEKEAKKQQQKEELREELEAEKKEKGDS